MAGLEKQLVMCHSDNFLLTIYACLIVKLFPYVLNTI